MRFLLCFSLFVCSLHAQEPSSAKDEWMRLSKEMSGQLAADLETLESHEEALGYGRLASIWWKFDRVSARAALDRSLRRAAAQGLDTGDETKQDDIRLAHAKLLEIVAPLDADAGKRLVEIIESQESPRRGKSTGGESEAAYFLASAANSHAGENNEVAMQLAEASLGAGGSQMLGSVLLGLRGTGSPQLADELLRKILAVLRSNPYDPFLGNILINELTPLDPSLHAPSQLLKGEMLAFVAEVLLRVPQDGEEQKQLCGAISDYAPVVHLLTPEQQRMVQATKAACPITTQRSAEARAKQMQDGTIDQLLQAAAAEPEARTRGRLKLRAAIKAHRDKDYRRELEILDSFTKEERREIASWSQTRLRSATDLAREFAARNDYPALFALVDESPADQRPKLQLWILQALREKAPPDVAIPLYRAARTALLDRDSEDPFDNLALLRSAATLAPEDVPVVLKHCLAALARFKKLEFTEERRMVSDIPDRLLLPLDVSFVLPHVTLDYLRAAINDVPRARLRASLRLGLISRWLAEAQAPPSAVAETKQEN